MAHAVGIPGEARVGGWIAARGCEEVIDAFGCARVSVAAIDPPSAVPANPQVIARGSLLEFPDPEIGPVRLATPPCGGTIRWLGRAIGADDAAIRAWLSRP